MPDVQNPNQQIEENANVTENKAPPQPTPRPPAGMPRERVEPPAHFTIAQSDPNAAGGGGAAFVPFGKRPLEFVTCYKVKIFELSLFVTPSVFLQCFIYLEILNS